MPPAVRAALLLLLCAAALWLGVARGGGEPAAGAPPTRDGDTVEITPAARAAGLRFAPGVAAADRAWVLAAVAHARPEAAGLIAAVDGLVEVRTDEPLPGGAIGLTQVGPAGIVVSFAIAELNSRAVLQRDTVVLHELGHVIDFALVPDALGRRLDAGIPRGGVCTSPGERLGACAEAAERFADTFAKWALRGAVSAAGAGYGIPTPPSLEDWGAPLGLLAVQLSDR